MKSSEQLVAAIREVRFAMDRLTGDDLAATQPAARQALETQATALRADIERLLEEIGVEGQDRLLASHALVIGAGGLGSPVALYLGTAGVGRITLVDHDTVDLTNLQRQIAHTLGRLGMPKAQSLAWSSEPPTPL